MAIPHPWRTGLFPRLPGWKMIAAALAHPSYSGAAQKAAAGHLDGVGRPAGRPWVDATTLKHFPFVDFVLRGEADCALGVHPGGRARRPLGRAAGTHMETQWRGGPQCGRAGPHGPGYPAFARLSSLSGDDRLPHAAAGASAALFDCTFCSTNNFFAAVSA